MNARLLVAAAIAFVETAAMGQFCGEIQHLGTLPDTQTSGATGVSADGKVVVGTTAGGGPYRSFRWSESRGLEGIGSLPGREAFAMGVSGDGAVIVGYARILLSTLEDVAFRWTDAGMVNLGTLPGHTRARAYGTNFDGSVVVGESSIQGPGGITLAFRWTESGGMQALPGVVGYAKAVSADGRVIVGSGNGHAFRWTEAGGVQDLGVLPSREYSFAEAVSADGQVVVGYSGGPGHVFPTQAFRWTPAGGLQGLGLPPNGDYSQAFGINADGSAVALTCSVSPLGRRAFRWTQTQGMQQLGVLPGRTSSTLSAMSADGTVVVGGSSGGATASGGAARWAFHRADCTGEGTLDIQDFTCFQNAFALADLAKADVGGPLSPCGTPDGKLDITDFTCFQNLFALGCP